MVDHPQTQIDLPFGDGVYTFRLNLPQLAELQKKCDAPLGEIFSRVIKGRYERGDEQLGAIGESAWAYDDLLQTIRLGLIGGNLGRVDGVSAPVDPLRAADLMAAYVYPTRPLVEAWELASAILGACIVGYTPKVKPPPGK